MKLKFLIVIASLLTALNCGAQKWKMGVTIGGDNNSYCIDTQYQYDWRYKDVKGLTMGLMGQYQLNDWFGLRADFNFTQKDYRQYRTGNAKDEDYTHHNNYLQLPVMASFSFGAERLRGFLNLGVYGAYWTDGSICGTTADITFGSPLDDHDEDEVTSAPVDQDYTFNSERDNRMELGAVAGLGVEYRFNSHWSLQAEARMYYSLTSTTKDYMLKKNPRYNTTTALQLGCAYSF